MLHSLTSEDLNRISVFAETWEATKATQVVERGRLDAADTELEKTCLLLAKHYQSNPDWLLSRPIFNLPRYIGYINTGEKDGK
ncbi:hypothetical protein [Pasteurella multocida]|uniref:hypothetical protein n=1 Tax=Pasteurella multocida TaxID=747 RepID=UPI001D1257F6|nr:hypothetical protein [Pasteurella multocida]